MVSDQVRKDIGVFLESFDYVGWNDGEGRVGSGEESCRGL